MAGATVPSKPYSAVNAIKFQSKSTSIQAINTLESEAWHEAINAITQQAERLVAEPGLWTAVFPLVVVCLCFATQAEFDQLWRFRLEQAMGMLQSPQVSASIR